MAFNIETQYKNWRFKIKGMFKFLSLQSSLFKIETASTDLFFSERCFHNLKTYGSLRCKICPEETRLVNKLYTQDNTTLIYKWFKPNNGCVTCISGHWAGFIRSAVQTGPVVQCGSGWVGEEDVSYSELILKMSVLSVDKAVWLLLAPGR